MNSTKRLKRRLGVAIVAAATATTLLLAGCTTSTPDPVDTPSGERGEVLTLAATLPPVSLNPVLQNVDPANNWFINLAYDPLIRVDAATGDLLPDLATSWEYLDDANIRFELTLREDVVFSDGTPLTAEAVADSLNYARLSGVNGPNWLASIASVTATEEGKVLITNSTPNDSLPFLLSQRLLMGSIIHPDGVDDPEILKSGTYGVGPYVLDTDATVVNDTYVYVPNDTYWDQTKIHWNRVEIKIVANTAAALQAVANGQADIFRSDGATAQAAEEQGIPFESVPFGLFGVNYVDRNGEVSEPLGDPRVREALSWAIDRPAITEAVYGDLATPNATLTVDGYAGFDPEVSEGFEFDMDKARELLAEAGYEDGFSFDMATTVAGNANLMAQAVIEGWAELGVIANLTTYTDTGALVTDILAKKYPVTVYAYGALPLYIQTKSFFNGGASQFNPFNTLTPELKSLLAEASLAAGEEAQNAAYEAVLQYAIVDQVWMSNIFTSSLPIVHSDRVTGVGITSTVPTPDVAWTVRPAS